MHQNEYEVKYRWMMRVQNTPRECVTPVGAASCARTRRCAPRRSASSTARSAASEACARQRRTPGEPGLFRVAASACKPWQPCANRNGNRRERWQTVQTVMKKEGMCPLNLPPLVCTVCTVCQYLLRFAGWFARFAQVPENVSPRNLFSRATIAFGGHQGSRNHFFQKSMSRQDLFGFRLISRNPKYLDGAFACNSKHLFQRFPEQQSLC